MRRESLLLVCLVVVCLVLSGCGGRGELSTDRVLHAQAAVSPLPSPSPAAPPQVTATPAQRAAITVHHNPRPAPPRRPALETLRFCPRDGFTPVMDLRMPAAAGPAPVVVFVHGGAWLYGSRREGFFVDALSPALVARGFAVAAVDYRLAGRHPWPAQIEDVKCAVRFLRANATALGIDSDRVAAWGESAGGHLVAMLAANRAEFESGPYLDRSSQVQAVLDVAGPADLDAADWPASSQEWIREVFGSDRERLRAVSPVTYLTRDVPPFLLIHGDRDDVVPYTQSLELARRLRMVGASVRFVTAEGASHDPNTGDAVRPPGAELVSIAVDFLATELHVS
jgi:acetyl esterase/lipase